MLPLFGRSPWSGTEEKSCVYVEGVYFQTPSTIPPTQMVVTAGICDGPVRAVAATPVTISRTSIWLASRFVVGLTSVVVDSGEIDALLGSEGDCKYDRGKRASRPVVEGVKSCAETTTGRIKTENGLRIRIMGALDRQEGGVKRRCCDVVLICLQPALLTDNDRPNVPTAVYGVVTDQQPWPGRRSGKHSEWSGVFAAGRSGSSEGTGLVPCSWSSTDVSVLGRSQQRLGVRRSNAVHAKADD